MSASSLFSAAHFLALALNSRIVPTLITNDPRSMMNNAFRRARTMHPPAARRPRPAELLTNLRADLPASLVVFLVALPLCVGIAVASGVPAELGIVTGIVGGLITGLLPGSSLQVSGPAAGLTVITLELVQQHGLASLGPVVLAAGLLQIGFGVARIGRWFQAISTSVVQGMLAGIGLVLIASQLYSATDSAPPGSARENLAGLPELLGSLLSQPAALAAIAVAGLTLLVMVGWDRIPRAARLVPGSLVAIVIVVVLTILSGLPVKRLSVGTLTDTLHPPGAAEFGALLDGTLLGAALVFALIASAESLFSATAVDRLHGGRPTRYNAELLAQGAGNTVCGALGALPMTAVIVRSAANVEAGARTRASRVLHGGWLLLFVVAIPQVLSLVPVAALAALLLRAGWKLLAPATVARMWRDDRGEAVVLTITVIGIAVTTLFEGVLIGIIAAIVKCAWELSHLHIHVTHESGRLRVQLSGHATFLRVPRLNHALETLPQHDTVHLDATRLAHFDRASRDAVHAWRQRQKSLGRQVIVDEGDSARAEAAQGAPVGGPSSPAGASRR